MDNIFKEYLFTKNILVLDEAEPSIEEVVVILTKLSNDYGIVIKDGKFLASKIILKFVATQFGDVDKYNGSAFYTNFPKSVKMMQAEQLLLDQLISYAKSYGDYSFDEQIHSIFEEKLEERAQKCKSDKVIKHFKIIKESEAIDEIVEIIKNLLKSSRPLNDTQYIFINHFKNHYLKQYNTLIDDLNDIPCKDTVCRFILSSNNLDFVKFMRINDILRFVEYIILEKYDRCITSIKKLNLRNVDRKIIASVIDKFFEIHKLSGDEFAEAFEKQKIWVGLLHHIHYKPKNNCAINFVNGMRSGFNCSNLSKIEQLLNQHKVTEAANYAVKHKGAGYFIRNLDYFISRIVCEEDSVESIIAQIGNAKFNPIVIMQAILHYNEVDNNSNRTFVFNNMGLIKTHIESEGEAATRRTRLDSATKDLIKESLLKLLDNYYSKSENRIENIFIDDDMSKIALPLNPSINTPGLGSLTTGSRVSLNSKKIRAFTYWEKVHDIDISAIGITNDGESLEFSWRTMYSRQSDAISYSGDVTSGFNGGSEYIDIDLECLKTKYPNIKYIIFNNNLYFGGLEVDSFNKCLCKAGFALREDLDAGMIYDPSTISTSFTIDADSCYAHLFAIDVEANELVWLNIAEDSRTRVAATERFDFIYKYMNIQKYLNYATLFKFISNNIVDDPNDADIVISDKLNGDNVIHSYDIDKVISYMI